MLPTSDESLTNWGDNPWQGRTVADMLDKTASEHGDRIALVDGTVRLSFAEVRGCRDRLAGSLEDAGVGARTHVAVLAEKSWEYAVLLHSIWMLGAVAVPLNTMWQRDELTMALIDADVDVLVAGRIAHDRPVADVLAALDIAGEGEVLLEHLPRLRRVIVGDRERDISRQDEWHLQSMIACGSRLQRKSDRQETLFLFTSGSAAKPKCAVLRQDGLLGTSYHYFQRLGVDASDRFLSLGPYFHTGGIVQLLGANQSGVAHYLFPKVDIPLVARVAVDEGCTVTAGFDTVLTKLIDEIERGGETLPFRAVGCAPGHAVRNRLAARGVRLVTVYAMTEGGNMITISAPGDDVFSNGSPLPGIDVRICGPVGGAPLSSGETGEICFRGWNLFRGYYNIGHSDGAFVTDADHYFRTGDIGRIDAAGRLHYLGRYSSMIKSGGENVSATEVEEFLVTQLGVAAAVVIGMPDPRWGEVVVAFVELAPDASGFDNRRLMEACRGRLAGYKVPKRFVEVRSGEWPVNESGKLLRASLADRL